MKKQNIQMAGIAVATNGNGNGHQKSEAAETGSVERVKITPSFDCLTTKWVDVLANMNRLENAKLFIDELVTETHNDHATIAGLMLLLDAINEKIENPKGDHPSDFINYLQTYLFNWTCESSKCADEYISAVKKSDFVLNELIDNSATWQPHAEEIMPPKKTVKAKANDVLEANLLEEPTAARSNAGNLAAHISEILNDPKVPGEIYDALANAVNEIAIDKSNLFVYDSPEYIGKVLEMRERNEQLEAEKPETEKPTAPADRLAGQLSELLNDPDLPKPLGKILRYGIDEFFNEHTDQSETMKIEESPVYLAAMIRGYTDDDGNAA